MRSTSCVVSCVVVLSGDLAPTKRHPPPLAPTPTTRATLQDGSGDVDIDEFIGGLQGMGLKLRESQFKSLHHDCDANGDGKVTLQEFTGAIQAAMKNSEKREKELAARWVATTTTTTITTTITTTTTTTTTTTCHHHHHNHLNHYHDHHNPPTTFSRRAAVESDKLKLDASMHGAKYSFGAPEPEPEPEPAEPEPEPEEPEPEPAPVAAPPARRPSGLKKRPSGSSSLPGTCVMGFGRWAFWGGERTEGGKEIRAHACMMLAPPLAFLPR